MTISPKEMNPIPPLAHSTSHRSSVRGGTSEQFPNASLFIPLRAQQVVHLFKIVCSSELQELGTIFKNS